MSRIAKIEFQSRNQETREVWKYEWAHLNDPFIYMSSESPFCHTIAYHNGVTPASSSSFMAPSAKGAQTVKGVKSNDLRMFFGPGGSQPKPVPAATSSQVSAKRVFHSYSKPTTLLG